MNLLIAPAIVILFIIIVVVPRRSRMKKKNLAILEQAGEKLEEVPIKQMKNITGVNSFIDSNYVLFFCTATGFKLYDIKTVKSVEIVSQRISGNRTYCLCLKDADGKFIGKELSFASSKEASAMQEFVLKYMDKYSESIQ